MKFDNKIILLLLNHLKNHVQFQRSLHKRRLLIISVF
jgi:hypothetical protein